MKNIAFLIAACMLKDHPEARKDHFEYDLEIKALEPACRAAGLKLVSCIWDDPEFDPSLYEAVVIGPCWDYMEKPDAFMALLERCSKESRLLNSLDVVRWNYRKTYLKDLEARGAPIVPSVWADKASRDVILDAFDTLGADDIVVKPVLGAGAWRQARIKRGEALPSAEQLPPEDCIIQPFLPSVTEEGEYTFLFFDRVYSHCALKRPAKGDYRVQSDYGGGETTHIPSAEELALAQSVLACIDGNLLYARVDMLRGLDGKLALMEIELIEPYLYPEQGPDMGASFAKALGRLLG